VRPVAYTRIASLTGLPVGVRKRKFFDLLLPAVLISKQRLEGERAEVTKVLAEPERSEADERWLQFMMDRYRATGPQDLLERLHGHPTSIVLAQAALETGWGTARFFRRANNVFGVWSFDEHEPRIPARKRRGMRTIYLKEYDSLIDSIDDYFVLMGRGPYGDFRRARNRTDDPLQLVEHLERYSELRGEYVKRLAAVIRCNDLQRFDRHRIDPRFLNEKG
jgi:Bax protein